MQKSRFGGKTRLNNSLQISGFVVLDIRLRVPITCARYQSCGLDDQRAEIFDTRSESW